MVYASFFSCQRWKAPWRVASGRQRIKKTVFKRLAPLGGKRAFENRLNESRRLFYFLRMMVASRSGPTETIVIGVPVAFSIYSM